MADNGNEKIKKDIEVIGEFIAIFCEGNHPGAEREPVTLRGKLADYGSGLDLSLCSGCSRLFLHGASKRIICPCDPKPSCKKCETHCYGEGYRERIREVMRYSGMRLIKKGRVGLIKKYLF